MLSQTRKDKILEFLKKKKQVSTQELENKLDVSGATIRNDLSELESAGLLRRIHGGAVMIEDNNGNSFISFHKRSEKNVEAKKVISSAAKDIIRDGQTILLDASSTILYLLPYLADYKKLTIITNGIYTAMEARNYEDFNVILLGGIVRRKSGSVEGLLCEDMLNNIGADVMLTSAHGFNLENGLTDFNFYEVELKKKMVEKADKVAGLIDHTKIGHTSAASFIDSENIDLLVTDSEIKESEAVKIRESGIELIIGQL